MNMTKSEVKFGCLSKTLTDFLYMSDEKRKKKYGNNQAKYYERVVKSVIKSFQDHKVAFYKLPQRYIDKINFRLEYDIMLRDLTEKKFIEEAPHEVLEEAITDLGIIRRTIYGERFEEVAGPDFDRTIKWLSIFKSELKAKKTEEKSPVVSD